MKINVITVTVLASALAYAGSVSAAELKYEPTNPAFGGNPFTGNYMLSTATAQRGNAPEKKRNTSEEFQRAIQSSLLSRISRDIADQILGEEARDSGSFTVGDTQVDFHREGGDVIINIQDSATGGQTTIQMPVPSY